MLFHQNAGKIIPFLTCIAVGAMAAPSRAELAVGQTSHAQSGSSLHVYTAKISLPADGLWRVRAPKKNDSIRELYLMPMEPSRLRQLGTRMYAALEDRQVQSGRWQVQMGYEACRQYAQEGNGRGPKTLADLANDKRWKYVAGQWNTQHWRIRELEDFVEAPTEGPFLHLVPNVLFQFTEPPPQADTNRKVRKVVSKKNRAVLAFELRPFVDDGKHWVVYTDGSCERTAINADLIKAQQVEIRPIIGKARAIAAEQPNLEYNLVLLSNQLVKSLDLAAYNQVLDENVSVSWNTANSIEASYPDLRLTIHEARKFAWGPYSLAAEGGVLRLWDQTDQPIETRTNRRRSLSMFSVLGGRAAIEETLQLQDLTVTASTKGRTVAIDSIPGVEVKSHPFEDLLAGQAGGSLEMARFVPPDRFFVYVGKPETISALLDRGVPFIAQMGASLSGNNLQFNTEARYLAKLGMTRDWVDAVLTSGLTSEMALFAPDLFFLDGTDVTVVAKLRQPELLRRLLGLLGAAKLDTQSVLGIPTSSGGEAYLALRENLLFISTNRGEIQKSIELWEQQGKGSLGASAEFRYMLTKLAVNPETRLYAYFSDPFVRRLVGPRVKIGQRRRMLAKAKMEALTARAMLARLDGHEQPPTVQDLVHSNHLPQSWQSEGISLDATGLVSSERYGTLPDMRSLPEIPLDNVTAEEAEAYHAYMENYSNYWRRFFDPIAIRLDEVGSDELELSTFILPLVDNSIYNGLRSTLAHQDDATPLSVPIVEPKPVLQFSANLKEQAWREVAGNFSEFFTRYSGASPAMLDDLGPSFHVAIFDADPIIAIGSGDIFGAFGGDVLRGGGDEMVMIPVALSMLTRPCSIMVETKSPERTSRYLRQAAAAGSATTRRRQNFGVSFYQMGDRDEWTWTMNFFGVVKLRYGVEVAGKYLVIRNIPWSSEDHVASVAPAELNAAMLQANPSACKQQLPGLFATASDMNCQAVMSGLGRLYPFMLSGSKSVDDAQTEHQRLYGFYPRPLNGDQWSWTDFRMMSKEYGEPTRQRQPAFNPRRPFGLMNEVDSLQLNMQFEEDGLRSSIRWRLR